MILLLNKLAGDTPLQTLEAARAADPTLLGVPMVYAGRLDPMAEGLLLVLAGPDRMDLDQHLRHDKTYEAMFLLGVSSDSHDALGRLELGSAPPPPSVVVEAVGALLGEQVLPMPIWSAYRVRGRPLHTWAREGRIAEIEVPTRCMRVTACVVGPARPVSATALLDDVCARIGRVHGEFRQELAQADWVTLGRTDPPLLTVQATLSVTSGTFVRALAHQLGQQLGCGALLLRLRRTRIGPFYLGM